MTITHHCDALTDVNQIIMHKGQKEITHRHDTSPGCVEWIQKGPRAGHEQLPITNEFEELFVLIKDNLARPVGRKRLHLPTEPDTSKCF